MLEELKDRQVEVVLGAFDAVEGIVVRSDDHWLVLRRRKKLRYVQIDKIRHLSVADR